MDGTRVPIPRDATEFAQAFNTVGKPLNIPVQRYLTDPAAWLRNHRTDIGRVLVFPVERASWSGRALPVILWREDPQEIEV